MSLKTKEPQRMRTSSSCSTLTHLSSASFNIHLTANSHSHHQFCCPSRRSRPKPPTFLPTAKPPEQTREEEEEGESDTVHQFCCSGSSCSSPSSR
ncbi:hypothetical protein SRHO_G00331710 [Serrasalmus rhombeus]